MISFIRKRCQYSRSKLRGLGSRGIPPHLYSGDTRAPTPCAEKISSKRNCAPASRLRGLFGDESGVLIMAVALAMPVLAGTISVAAYACGWFLHQPAMQNADGATAIVAVSSKWVLAVRSNRQDAA
jgi:hypothetical protein